MPVFFHGGRVSAHHRSSAKCPWDKQSARCDDYSSVTTKKKIVVRLGSAVLLYDAWTISCAGTYRMRNGSRLKAQGAIRHGALVVVVAIPLFIRFIEPS